MKLTSGRLPSALRGPMMTLASLVLAKSPLAGVMFRSHVLNVVSTPVMLVFLFGKPMLFRILWTLSPIRMIVIDESPGGLASMLYCVPFMYDVLLYQSLPPDEWFA